MHVLPLQMATCESAAHAYSHVAQTQAMYHAPRLDAGGDAIVCSQTYCAEMKLYILYLTCVFLNFLAFAYKQILFFWCALGACTLACVVCCRLSCVSVGLQIVVGLIFYTYWLNFFNIWHRPHYHHAPNWPWIAAS